MKVLGHRHASMSMTYINMSDPAVLADYSSVLKPGAVLAGRQSDAIRNQQLSEEAIDWLKSNFLKTELELGRCLRLPQEGPCECDLYLSCSKFVTTPAYADRLRHRSLSKTNSSPTPKSADVTAKSNATNASAPASLTCFLNSTNPSSSAHLRVTQIGLDQNDARRNTLCHPPTMDGQQRRPNDESVIPDDELLRDQPASLEVPPRPTATTARHLGQRPSGPRSRTASFTPRRSSVIWWLWHRQFPLRVGVWCPRLCWLA